MDNEIIEGLIKSINVLGADVAELNFEMDRDDTRFTVKVKVSKERYAKKPRGVDLDIIR